MDAPAITDPIEARIAEALQRAGMDYEHEAAAPNGRIIDFYVPNLNLFIEAKAFDTERTAAQVRGLTNVIVIQGREAAEAFDRLINP